ncbi:MAG: hypothetical protein ACLUD2_04170 [Clostridium sp.]
MGIGGAACGDFAAGMAAAGLKPVVGGVLVLPAARILTRCSTDVCIQNLPVVFALDRAGLVGSDGETHQGIFDLPHLSCIPEHEHHGSEKSVGAETGTGICSMPL